MTTYALLHGAGSDSWYWHLVAPLLRERGHAVVAPDLPCDDDGAGIDDYAKAALEVLRLHENGEGDVTVVGDDLIAGERPQLLVPAQTFHVSRVQPGGSWALLATTVFPGLEPDDVELGDLDELTGRYPAFATEIRTFGGGR